SAHDEIIAVAKRCKRLFGPFVVRGEPARARGGRAMRTFCQMAVSLGVLSVVGCASSAVARKPAAGEASAASAARESAAAGAPVRPVPPSPPAACRLSVEDEHGQPLPTYAHQGKTWVLGTLGQRYVVRVSNHGPGRVEAVVSVDGRDVVSGEV